jgi:tRNA(His) 5'-end guanylyltransferase
MGKTMLFLCENISNCIFGYTQSDEITLVLYNPNIDSEPWFDNRLEKIVSLSASLGTLAFNKYLMEKENIDERKLWKATFDARAFNVPVFEVVNNIIWRQQDATKNSINSVAQANFSHKELQGKNGSEMQDMLMLQKGINWNDTPTKYKRGMSCIRKPVEIETPNGNAIRNKWVIDEEIPIISQDREYVEKLLV